jgi:hypothetical protein
VKLETASPSGPDVRVKTRSSTSSISPPVSGTRCEKRDGKAPEDQAVRHLAHGFDSFVAIRERGIFAAVVCSPGPGPERRDVYKSLLLWECDRVDERVDNCLLCAFTMADDHF